jgi:hypothetical protein
VDPESIPLRRFAAAALVGGSPYHPRMELTPAQRRTLEQLIGVGPPPPYNPRLAGEVRRSIERRLGESGVIAGEGEPIWLGKQRLNNRDRCEGLFEATLLREGPPFERSPSTAAGGLFHKAIELDIVTERAFDPVSVSEQAAGRLGDADDGFGAFWRGLDPFGKAELVAEAGRRLSLFRDSLPPLPRRWAPQPELLARVRLGGGAVVLSAVPDLVLGRSRRLLIDFKSGRLWPEHPEDMRFYALVFLLRTGVPPYRVATFFLDSGEWQSEEVSEQMLSRAADRVVQSATTAHSLRSGRHPDLRPGRHCAWCPRRAGCPAVETSDPWIVGVATDR